MIINLISTPRNISTALMYSFAQRIAIKVMDEPFYGYYLKKTGIDHPGTDEIIANMSTESQKVIENISALQSHHEEVFVKNMAHHHIDFDWNYLNDFHNVFLIRDPKQIIASFAQVIENPTIDDIGLKHESDLFDHCKKYGKYSPIVIDSNDLLSNPEKYLSELCKQLGITFSSSMLSWQKGAIAEDGIWAKYWYKNVHNSEGFEKQKTSSRSLDAKHEPLHLESSLYFKKLSAHKSIHI